MLEEIKFKEKNRKDTKELLRFEIDKIPEIKKFLDYTEKEKHRRIFVADKFMTRPLTQNPDLKYFYAPFVTDRSDMGIIMASITIFVSQEIENSGAEDVFIEYENGNNDFLDIKVMSEWDINNQRFPEISHWYIDNFTKKKEMIENVAQEQPEQAPNSSTMKAKASLEYRKQLKKEKLEIAATFQEELKKRFPEIKMSISGSLSETGFRHSIGSDIDLDIVAPKRIHDEVSYYVDTYLTMKFTEKYNVMIDALISSKEDLRLEPFVYNLLRVENYTNELMKLQKGASDLVELFENSRRDPFLLAANTKEILPKPSNIEESFWDIVMKYRTPRNFLETAATTFDKTITKQTGVQTKRYYFIKENGVSRKICEVELDNYRVPENELERFSWKEIQEAFEKDMLEYCAYCQNPVVEIDEEYEIAHPAGSELYKEGIYNDHYKQCENSQILSWLQSNELPRYQQYEILEQETKTPTHNRADINTRILFRLLELGKVDIVLPNEISHGNNDDTFEFWFEFQKIYKSLENKNDIWNLLYPENNTE